MQKQGAFKHRRLLWFLPFILSSFGVLTIASISSSGGLGGQISLYSTGGRQLLTLFGGVILMCVCATISLNAWKKLSPYIWLLAVGLLAATLIPGLGVRAGGARRWLNLGFGAFQPLELMSFIIPIYMAKCISGAEGKPFAVFLRITCIIAGISVIPLLFQPNLGGTILIVAICFSIHIENRGWTFPVFCGALLSAVIMPFIVLVEYRMRRVVAFLDPWADPLNAGFQAIQGKIAFANGGAWGLGVGKGLQKLNYLPAAHTDYIFSVVGEEFGILGTLGILLIFCIWFLVAWGLYKRQNDPFRAALTLGLTVSVMFPLFINLGGVMSLMPLTGIPLPFVSYGGSALLLMWAKIGVLMRVAKESGGAVR